MALRFVSLILCVVLVGCAAKRQAQWETAGAPVASPESGDDARAAGDDAWTRRTERAEVEKAIAAWEQTAERTPNDPAIWAKLTRAYYFLADGFMRSERPEAALAIYEKGIAAGERALGASNEAFRNKMTSGAKLEEALPLLTEKEVEPAYWYSANLGRWAKAKGIATQLANKDKIKAVMDWVLSKAPDYFQAAPYRYFGAYYAIAPGFAGGDMNLSKQNFDKALQMAPQYAGNLVLMAETYAVKKQDRALFDKLLSDVVALPDDAVPEVAEQRVEKAKAAELKKKAEELF